MRGLGMGKFLCQLDEGKPFILQIPDSHIDDKTIRSKLEQEEIMTKQHELYYRKVETPIIKMDEVPRPPDERKGTKEKFKPKYK